MPYSFDCFTVSLLRCYTVALLQLLHCLTKSHCLARFDVSAASVTASGVMGNFDLSASASAATQSAAEGAPAPCKMWPVK